MVGFFLRLLLLTSSECYTIRNLFEMIIPMHVIYKQVFFIRLVFCELATILFTRMLLIMSTIYRNIYLVRVENLPEEECSFVTGCNVRFEGHMSIVPS